MSGKIVARAVDGKVEVIMTDGEDAAITKMPPETALKLAMDIIAAAGEAAR